MKINAFARLIRTIACGVVVLGASNALGQVTSDVRDGGTTFGTLQSVDEIGNDIDDGNAGPSFTHTQDPAAGNTGSSSRQIYYPPGVEIPLRETEIPGSAYFVGPDGERIDASKMMNQVPAGQERLIPSKDAVQLSPGHSFSTEGTYDGTLAFPMGTFPTTPFGERIISQVPADQSAADKSESGEIQGALVDENGKTIESASGDGATPAMENGVPADQIVRPGDSPKGVAKDRARGKAMRVLKPSQSGGIQGLKNEVRVFLDPTTGQVTLLGDEEDTALVAMSMQELAKQDSKSKTIIGKERLEGLLKKANRKAEALKKEVIQLKASGKKQNNRLRSQMASLKMTLEKTKAKASEAGEKLDMTEKNLKEAQRQLEDTRKMAEKAQMALQEKYQVLEAKAESNASQAEAKIAAAEANAEKARAEVLALTQKMAADSEAADVGAIGIAAGGAEMTAPRPADAPGEVAGSIDAMAIKAKEAKAAAELEVSRKLKEMEERKRKADAAKDAAEDAAASDKEEMAEGKEAVLSLDDQIKQLKTKRDQQIAESETRIRAKQQREIDKLLEEGKAVDSDEVKAAVDKMKGAIKTSEEKLRSRFLRRLERLKENMKKTLK